MDPQKSVYAVSNFVPRPSEELVCPLCKHVLCDPVKCPCNHVFCISCLQSSFRMKPECPSCQLPMIKPNVEAVEPIVKNIIMKLTLQCCNEKLGCEAKLTLENYDTHVKECSFQMVKCKKFCKRGIFKKDIVEHEQVCSADCHSYCRNCELYFHKSFSRTHDCVGALQFKLLEEEAFIRQADRMSNELKDKIKAERPNKLFGSDSTPQNQDQENLNTSLFIESDSDGLTSFLMNDTFGEDSDPEWHPSMSSHFINGAIESDIGITSDSLDTDEDIEAEPMISEGVDPQYSWRRALYSRSITSLLDDIPTDTDSDLSWEPFMSSHFQNEISTSDRDTSSEETDSEDNHTTHYIFRRESDSDSLPETE